MKEKVLVAMSGGVDSSVAAALLVEQKYDVMGMMLKMFDSDNKNECERFKTCCSLDDVEDARSVAEQLNIPFYVSNTKVSFGENVIKRFIDSYLAGLTPNPCIDCNKYIKWDTFFNKAIALGIDYIATGHYAINEYDENRGRYILKRPVDKNKDQTYVLYNMTQEQLKRTKFPLGSLDKPSVRRLAESIHFRNANKPDSQEICFVQDNDYAKFITEHTDKPIKGGNFLDTKGNVIGHHNGIIHYTIGQRKGLGTTFGKRVYVVSKNAQTNDVVLGDNEDLFASKLIANELNWISIPSLEKEMRVKAKHRYKATEADATIFPQPDGTVFVKFDEPQRAITPGQAIVFYDNDEVVGGGRIIKSMK